MCFLSFRTQVLGCRFLVLDRCFYLVFGCGFCCWDFVFGAWLLFWLWALVDVFVHSTTTLHRISCDIMWFHGFSWDLMDAHMKHL